ncbi:MAG: serine/threonine protein kinase [Proteobacteria bacterium]|nr:serine/threonine protein kinase [Pseudomonadota bacterium]
MNECPKCHTKYDESPAFCGTCGMRISGVDLLAPPPADPLVGITIDGRYRIIDLIGRGGMGAVYRVEHVKMGKIMAVKILQGELSRNSDVRRRFKREAEAASLLTHANNVSVFDFGTYEGMMYLVMEYIDGQDLAKTLAENGPFPFHRIIAIMIQVCSALAEAHAKGIVHRDLKPGNILIGTRDEQKDFVKVVDFGLASLRDMNSRTKITEQGSIVGTPYYMAPEHIKGEDSDSRSDLYSLGAVIYKLLTGEVPFAANTPMEVISKHLAEPLQPMSSRYPELNIPTMADTIVLKAMEKSPDDRYQSAEELRTALADAIESITPGSDFRRFSSSQSAPPPKPALRVGQQTPPVEAMAIGNQNVFDAPLPLQTAKTTGRGSAPKSIIIGERQVTISTKSDFIYYERKLKRQRLMRIGIWSVVAIALIVIAVTFVAQNTGDDSIATHETEPNDISDQADTLWPNAALSGFISGPGSDPQGDIDWFRLPGPGTTPWIVEVEISSVPGLDIALQLIEPGATQPLLIINNQGQGKPERIGPTKVTKSIVFLMVQEVRAPGITPGNFVADPYRLLFRSLDGAGGEAEPNNTISSSTAVALGMEVTGTLHAVDDIDWFCHPAGKQVKTVHVTGMPEMDLALDVQFGSEVKPIFVNNYSKGKGEAVTLPKGLGPTCVGVKQHDATNASSPTVSQGSYKILFQ